MVLVLFLISELRPFWVTFNLLFYEDFRATPHFIQMYKAYSKIAY